MILCADIYLVLQLHVKVRVGCCKRKALHAWKTGPHLTTAGSFMKPGTGGRRRQRAEPPPQPPLQRQQEPRRIAVRLHRWQVMDIASLYVALLS